MKQITIGFSRASTKFPIFSWLIMAVQRTNYSHVYLKYTDPYLNQPVYYQASHTLVNYMSQETFLAQETVVEEYNFNVSEEAYKAWMEFAIANAGKPYGVMEILGLTLVNLGMALGIKINNPIKDAGTTWVCNQLITAGLEECDKVTLLMPLNNMEPKDTRTLVASLPGNLS